MITDIHRHFVPPDFFRYMCERGSFEIEVKRSEDEAIDLDIRGIHFGLNPTFFDLARQRSLMAEQGVERAILSLATPFINYGLEAPAAVDMAQRFNDSLAQSIDGQAQTFGAWAFLPMQAPEAAAAELRRCVNDYGFAGGHIASNVQGTYLNDERFEPVYKAALDLNVPLFVHPADPAGKDRMREYELMVVAGYLFDSTINILKMVCSGFLDRWPNLKLVCAHTGAFSLPLRARMQREVDTNPLLAEGLHAPIGDYLARLYYDTICFEPAMLRYATTVVPLDHLFLGSDAPFPLGEPNPVTFVRDALPADQSAAIFHENFPRFLAR
jgi:aminocarboxymuconate-semialdehyde decarboxylase